MEETEILIFPQKSGFRDFQDKLSVSSINRSIRLLLKKKDKLIKNRSGFTYFTEAHRLTRIFKYF